MVRKRLDVLMVILMMIVMSYQAVRNLFHEVAGAALLVDQSAQGTCVIHYRASFIQMRRVRLSYS